MDDEKNLTVIYAENGFGKTTFLNALNWTLFGTFVRFERQDDLINRQAAKEGTSASVDVTFEFR